MPNIPPNLAVPLQASGLDVTLEQAMPYADGIIMVLTGQAESDGDIITQDVEMALKNTGLNMDDLGRFLLNLNDNIKVVKTSMPAMNDQELEFYRAFYFAIFIEYIKSFSMNTKFMPPEMLVAVARKQHITPEMFTATIGMQVFNKNMYALTVKNPGNIQQPHICPWVFIYNDAGNTKLFLSKEAMEQYDKKYGKGLTKTIGKLFDKEHRHITGIGAACVAGAGIGIGILLKKRSNKKKEKEQAMITEIEAEAGDE